MAKSELTSISSIQTGYSVRIGDCKTTFLTTSDDTAGQYCVFEHDLPAGFPGPPPHAHRVTTHTFYVIEGLVTIVVDGRFIKAEAGTSVYIPAGVVHQFSNPGQQRSRMLEIDTPGTFQAYFEELGQFFSSGQPMSQQSMALIQQKYDFIPAAS